MNNKQHKKRIVEIGDKGAPTQCIAKYQLEDLSHVIFNYLMIGMNVIEWLIHFSEQK